MSKTLSDFSEGDEIVVCIPLGTEGDCGGYYSGERGVVVGFVEMEDWVLVSFPDTEDIPRDSYATFPSELRHLTPLEKAMK